MPSHEQYLENYIKPVTGEGRVFEAFRQVDRAKFTPAGAKSNPYSNDVIVLGPPFDHQPAIYGGSYDRVFEY